MATESVNSISGTSSTRTTAAAHEAATPTPAPSPGPPADRAPQDKTDISPEAQEPEEECTPSPTPSPGQDTRTGNLQVGNMNVGGGNKEARARFDEIKKTVGEQVTRNGIDLATFQEVEVGTGRIGGKDYNKEILSGIFEADLGGQDTRAVGDNRYETTLPNGEKKTVTITQEEPGDGNGNVNVYTARYQDENGQDVEYTMVYGQGGDKDGGSYGNSVLLGPEQSLPRDENGRIQDGAIKLHHIGNDPGGGENRTALEVNTAEGQTAICTHLTAGGEDDQQKARSAQYKELQEIVKSRPKAVLGGDFNSTFGEDYTVGGLGGWNPFGKDYKYPTAGQLGGEEGTDGSGFDHILVRGGDALDQHTAEGVERVHGFQWVDVVS